MSQFNFHFRLDSKLIFRRPRLVWCKICYDFIYYIHISRRPGLGVTLDRRTSHSLRNPSMSSSEFCTFLWTYCCRYEIYSFLVLFPLFWLISSLQFGATEVVVDFQNINLSIAKGTVDPRAVYLHQSSCFWIISQGYQNSASNYWPNFSLKILTKLLLRHLHQNWAILSRPILPLKIID